MLTYLREEKFLLLAVVAALLAFPFEYALLSNGQGIALAGGIVLVLFIVSASMRVAHHAELLAHKVGDPYGHHPETLS